MHSIADLPAIDYEDPAYSESPFRWLAKQAATHKIGRSQRGVELLDYTMCRNMLLDRNLGTDHGNLVEKMGLPEGRTLDFKRRMILTQNRGDTRKRLRNALTGLIGPSQAQQMRTEIRSVIETLLAGLPDGEFDLKHAFADLVPAGVYCHWVKAPLVDARFVSDMSETVLKIFRRDPSLTPEILAAYDQLFAYAKARIADRRAEMGDDFISRLIRVHESGGLSEGELEDFVVMLIEASTDNTAHQLAIAVDRLTQMPDIWAAIGQNPALVDAAVTEVMRLWPRSISTSRTALQDTEIEGIFIPKGTSVFASFGAAHRQPDVFDNPHDFQLDRPARPMHMNFGGGAFSCLGQFVASIEVSEAVSALAARYPNLSVLHADRAFTPMFQTVSRLTVAPT